jgi:hypothetical protein
VSQAKLACGRVGDNVDGMVVQPDRPALRLLSGPAACMTASWCICMARGIVPPHATVEVPVPQARAACHGPRTSWSRGSSCEPETCRARWRHVAQGGDLLREVETCRTGWRLVVRGGDLLEGIPLVGNWSEMLSTGRKRDVLPVWVLTRVLSLPRLESCP